MAIAKIEYKFIEIFSLYDGTKAGFPHRIFEYVKLKRGSIYAIP